MSITSPEEVQEIRQARKQRFWDYFSMVLSIAYGLGVIICSCCLYCSDLVMNFSFQAHYSESWNLFLCTLGTLLLLFLAFDIHRYIKAVTNMNKGAMSMEGIKLVEGDDGELHIEVPMHQGEKRNVPEYYGFTSGRYTRKNIIFFKTFAQTCWKLLSQDWCSVVLLWSYHPHVDEPSEAHLCHAGGE